MALVVNYEVSKKLEKCMSTMLRRLATLNQSGPSRMIRKLIGGHRTQKPGGSDTADNGVYIDSSTNQSIGDRPMTSQEVADARDFSQEIAEINSPGTTGDFGAVLGEVVDVTAMGSLMGLGWWLGCEWRSSGIARCGSGCISRTG